MTRAALATVVSLAALAGCSSTPIYRAHVAPANTGELEGTGDALGNALFAEDVILAKSPHRASEFNREYPTLFVIVPDDAN